MMRLPALLWALRAPRHARLTLRGQRYTVRLLSALDLLACVGEAAALCRSGTLPPGEGEVLAENAALAAACLRRFGRPVFRSAAQALKQLTADELAQITACYADLRKKALEPAGGFADLESAAAWVLLARGLGVGDRAARQMSEAELLYWDGRGRSGVWTESAVNASYNEVSV